MRGPYSARVPRSSLARVHKELVHQEEVDGQEENRTTGEKMDSKESKVEEWRRIKHTT